MEAWKEDTGHRHRLDQRFADVSDDDVAELSDGDLLEVETESSSVVSAPAGAAAGGAKGPAPDEPEPITEASSLASFIERAQRGALNASALETPVPSPETPLPSPEKPLAAVPPALPQAAPPSPAARASSHSGRRWLVVAGALGAVAAAGVAWSLRPTPAAVEKPTPSDARRAHGHREGSLHLRV